VRITGRFVRPVVTAPHHKCLVTGVLAHQGIAVVVFDPDPRPEHVEPGALAFEQSDTDDAIERTAENPAQILLSAIDDDRIIGAAGQHGHSRSNL